MNEKIISALVGLAGAIGNNGKTEYTDLIVMNALLNCETCPTPCGNTSDYDIEKFLQNKELKAIKEELIAETVALAKRVHSSGKKYYLKKFTKPSPTLVMSFP